MRHSVIVIPRSDAESSVCSPFHAFNVFWIPRRSAELKVAVKAMTITECLT